MCRVRKYRDHTRHFWYDLQAPDPVRSGVWLCEYEYMYIRCLAAWLPSLSLSAMGSWMGMGILNSGGFSNRGFRSDDARDAPNAATLKPQ